MTEKKLCYNCFCEKEDTDVACPYCGSTGIMNHEHYPVALEAGTVLQQQYVIGRVLGQGGFGVTYEAYDNYLKTIVAIKEYFPENLAIRLPDSNEVAVYSGDKQDNFQYGANRFLDEARVLAQFMEEPNIISVKNYFRENQTAYFVMEYIKGISYKTYLKEHGGKVSYEDALSKLTPVMDALSLVHKKGVIHRDVTPDNIYITENGQVKLLDFGSARYSMGEKSVSLDVILKTGYAPKEQYTRRGRQGAYTDVYSLAACLYVSITGVIPPESLERMDEDELQPISEFGIIVPDYVEAAIMKGLSVQAKERFQSMEEFKYAVWNITPPEPDQAANIVEPDKKRKNPWLYVGIVALILVAVIALTALFIDKYRESHPSVTPALSDQLTPEPSATPTLTPTASLSPTPTPTSTPTPTPTITPSPTVTPTPTVSPTPNPSPTSVIIATEAPSPTPSPVPTKKPDPTPSPAAAVTETTVKLPEGYSKVLFIDGADAGIIQELWGNQDGCRIEQGKGGYDSSYCISVNGREDNRFGPYTFLNQCEEKAIFVSYWVYQNKTDIMNINPIMVYEDQNGTREYYPDGPRELRKGNWTYYEWLIILPLGSREPALLFDTDELCDYKLDNLTIATLDNYTPTPLVTEVTGKMTDTKVKENDFQFKKADENNQDDKWLIYEGKMNNPKEVEQLIFTYQYLFDDGNDHYIGIEYESGWEFTTFHSTSHDPYSQCICPVDAGKKPSGRYRFIYENWEDCREMKLITVSAIYQDGSIKAVPSGNNTATGATVSLPKNSTLIFNLDGSKEEQIPYIDLWDRRRAGSDDHIDYTITKKGYSGTPGIMITKRNQSWACPVINLSPYSGKKVYFSFRICQTSMDEVDFGCSMNIGGWDRTLGREVVWEDTLKKNEWVQVNRMILVPDNINCLNDITLEINHWNDELTPDFILDDITLALVDGKVTEHYPYLNINKPIEDENPGVFSKETKLVVPKGQILHQYDDGSSKSNDDWTVWCWGEGDVERTSDGYQSGKCLRLSNYNGGIQCLVNPEELAGKRISISCMMYKEANQLSHLFWEMGYTKPDGTGQWDTIYDTEWMKTNEWIPVQFTVDIPSDVFRLNVILQDIIFEPWEKLPFRIDNLMVTIVDGISVPAKHSD